MRCGVLKVIRLSTTLVKCILYNKAKKKNKYCRTVVDAFKKNNFNRL